MTDANNGPGRSLWSRLRSLVTPDPGHELRESLEGIPPTLLSARLRRLVGDGLLAREGSGRQVTYSFTERGAEIRPVLRAMRDFGAALIDRKSTRLNSSH